MTVVPWIFDDEPLPSPKNAPSNDPNIPSGLIALTESISTQRLIEAMGIAMDLTLVDQTFSRCVNKFDRIFNG